jgi:hypothetical protein
MSAGCTWTVPAATNASLVQFYPDQQDRKEQRGRNAEQDFSAPPAMRHKWLIQPSSKPSANDATLRLAIPEARQHPQERSTREDGEGAEGQHCCPGRSHQALNSLIGFSM